MTIVASMAKAEKRIVVPFIVRSKVFLAQMMF
jgi:hypothetical protein